VPRVKLLISGLPCCGKTYFGDTLRDLYGFVHANLEQRPTPDGTIVPPGSSFELPHWLASLADNVVATWGFAPCPGWRDLLNEFGDAGFTLWWFYSEPGVARERYASREGEQKTADRFDPQMHLLDRANEELSGFYGDRMIETLTSRGYKTVDETYTAMLDWSDSQDGTSATARALMRCDRVAIPFVQSVA
jgi:hypothetical protein